jgi:hypothetical protein
MRFQSNISLLLGRIEARRHVEFTENSGPLAEAASWRGGEVVAARLGEGSRAPCLAAERQDIAGASRLASWWPLPPEWIGASRRVDRSDWTRGFSWETPERIGEGSWTGVAAHQRSV